MDISISCQPAYSLAVVRLEHGESVSAESGAMAMMSGGIKVQGRIQGGLIRGAIRKAFGDESFFMARYTAETHGAWVALAPRYPGDIAVIDIVPGEDILIEAGASLGFSDGVTLDTQFSGIRTIALREGATVLRASGQGPMLICSYGGIQAVPVRAGEQLIVDTGHLVAWTASMDRRFGPLGDVVTSVTTGEGLVGQLTGPGTVWIQTRAEVGMREWIFPEKWQNKGGRGR
jgi:uncharacterized protein (TIGR00266 family)